MGVKPDAAVGRGNSMLDHNGPVSQFPAGRKILQFTITAETAQVLIPSVILANLLPALKIL